MMAKSKVDKKPQKPTIPLGEIEYLVRLKESPEWDVFKRLCGRYIDNLRVVSFKLLQTDPNFVLRHTEYTGQALGIKSVIKAVEDSAKKMEGKDV